MAQSLHSQHEKVSGSSAGRVGRVKKGGYAGPGPDSIVIGTKTGITKQVGYSGPNITKANANR